MFLKSSELCFDNVDYVFFFGIMFWEFKLCFPCSNYVRKASELCFDNVNSNCAW